ncbi:MULTISPECIES: asparaginase [Streptomyces]|uniref:asparaginase n=1 Tax=Streptomyces TaxID=1883 RepID=UPI0022497B82|nr:asparaginase [Streptomyces sp. JHD 1]MCX2969295.1 asparaginase [Streptomyces sp. JHD 1]
MPPTPQPPRTPGPAQPAPGRPAPAEPGGQAPPGGRADSGGQAPPVLAEVVRSGFVEGRHRGSLVVLGADGAVEWALGDVTSPVFPRSSNKPFQAVACLRAGADLHGERLALAAASHSGEVFHRELVARLLAEHGFTEDDLRCPADLPLDREEAESYLAAGHARAPITMNCSGKHAAMLAACRAAGWTTGDYLDPGHPLQELVADTLADAAGEPVAATGTDGCGAPVLAVSLTGLARAFAALAGAAGGTPPRRVADAMRAHPEYVAGTRRHDTWLMREVPGTVSKMGAEAVQAVALPDGRALAFKLDDGGVRALGPVLARALERLGVASPVLARIGAQPLLGGGERVGEVRAAF